MTPTDHSAVRQLGELTQASLRLDSDLARCRHLSRRTRARLLAGKHVAAAALLAHRPAHLQVGAVRMELHTLSDLGTTESAIVDVQHELVATGVLVSNTTPRVIDVGANIGQFAAAVLLAAPTARITCFEPDPAIFERLTGNLGPVAMVTTRPEAVLDYTGQAELHRHSLSVMSTLHPEDPASYTGGTVTVPVAPLDAAVPSDEPVHLLKIDVEGAEHNVLAGARSLLSRTRYLLLEVSLNRPASSTNLDVLHLIRTTCPHGRLMHVGRPLGPRHNATCQDFLFALNDHL